MRRIAILATLMVAAVCIVATMAFAAVPGPPGGKWHVNCPYSNDNQVDPIVSPGQQMSAHMHQFFGNRGITPDTTSADLFLQATTCKDKLDHSGYWVPAMYRTDTGAEVFPRLLNAYYYGTPGVTVEPIPAGAKMLTGDAHAMARQSKAIVAWSCGNSQNTSSPVRDAPYDCTGIPNTHGVTEVLKFPYCWDGTGLEPMDFTYGVGRDFACPAGFEHRLVRPVLFVRYDNAKGEPFLRGDLVELASDRMMGETGGITLHGDFFDGWDQDHLTQLVADCASPATAHNCGES